uniref:NB-ARC domain-containing protein n=1 Tax=Leersia perrieri TaxID=77586 RepID=A0A0D9WGI4_9ORYZ
MGEAAVVGWLVCPVIRIVVDKAKACASDKIRWLNGGVPDALTQLQNALTQLRAVAGAVERSLGGGCGRGDPDLVSWLRHLKEVVYEADDVIDDFNYRRHSSQDGKVSLGSSSISKFGKQLVGKDESLNKLKAVVQKLDGIFASSGLLMQAAGLPKPGFGGESSSPQPRADGPVTGSMLGLEDEEVFGRDAELADMVSWLIAGTDDGAAADQRADTVPVAAIMGHGGMGKTTLARLLCHDQEVKGTFDLIMWVCPAGNYNKLDLTKQILHSADVQLPDSMTSFDWMQKKLAKSVSSRRFLLILDNIWDKNEKDVMDEHSYSKMWSDVLVPLRCGRAGSKILVTTRRKIVADSLNANKQVWLNELKFADIWLLFKKCAFGNDDVGRYSELKEIGEKIAMKLKGLPLAAEVVGGMLKGTRSSSEWKRISEMGIYDSVSSTLELCYRNLQEHLQPCFAICSIFPKNWRFKRDKLIKIWMALGFIQPRSGDGKNQLEEDVGKEYFNQLLARSFFHERKEGRRTYYYIHDLMHDLAENVSRVDCARVESADKKDICVPDTVRHLSVTSNAVMQLKGRIELKRLRTFIIFKHSSSSLVQLPDDILKELKGLRVLGLDGCDIVELSDKVGLLIHLRYLALCRTITKLPKSVTKLFLLQTLSIPKRCQLEEFPKDMWNLKYLRHLDTNRTSTSKVVGIGKLIHLQGSIEFHVKKEKGHTLEDLNDMNGLRRKLHIKNLDVVASKEEASKAGLSKKQSIKVLELEWNSTGKSVPSIDVQVLEGLEPHSLVEEVHIRRYHGTTSPSWLDMSCRKDKTFLKYLHLTNCRKWEFLPPLGELPFLKLLHLKEMCSLKHIGSEFYGTNSTAFPCLEDLEFDDMPKWVEWISEEGKHVKVFPELRKLKLLNCPNLIQVPSFPLSVRKATVENTGFVSHLKLSPFTSSTKGSKFKLETFSAAVFTDGLFHQQRVQEIVDLTLRHGQDVKFEELHALSSLKRLQIAHLDITDEQLGTCLQCLQSVTLLDIVHCSKVTTFPQIESPSCLKFHELNIRQCPQLFSLHSLPSFATLETVLIENCSRVTAESFPANFNSLTSLRKLSIMHCTGLESLPSGFPSSLQVVHLIGCKPTLLSQLQNKDGPEWDKVAFIPMKLIH